MPTVRIAPEYPGLVVSSDGQIQGSSGKWLGPSMGDTGYARACVKAGDRRKFVSQHTIVCTAFHGPRPTPKHEVAHLNGDPLDNRAVNLSWVTHRENEAHKIEHGTVSRGSRNGQSKLSEEQVQKIRRERSSGLRFCALAVKYGVSESTIRRIVNKIDWSWM